MKRLMLASVTLCWILIGCDNSTNQAPLAYEQASAKVAANHASAAEANDGHLVRLGKDDLKIKTVRSMYDDLQAGNDLPTIFDKYGERDLQSARELATAKASTDEQMYDNGISDCDEVGWELNLLPTQDLDVKDIIEVDYRVLKNGNVRASMITDPYNKDVDSHEFDIYKDYTFNCDADICKVTDVLSAEGISTKSEIRKYCR